MFRQVMICVCVILAACSGSEDAGETTAGAASTGTGDDDDPTGEPTPTSSSNTSDGPDPTSEGSSTTEPGTTGELPAICGDGIVDADEECDLGAQNSDAGACLADCSAAQCGDGKVQVGIEACDLGYGVNHENGSCLPDCGVAKCGDGHVQVGIEGCDLGDANGFGHGKCNPETCQPEPFCGDGIVQPDHEICDPAAEPAEEDPVADVECDEGCRYAGRIVFISAAAFDGNLGSVSDADLKCQVMAAKFDSEHATHYRAWLSDGESSPVTRFAHGPEFAAVPYVLRNGVQVAASFDALVLSGVENPITMTETGETLTMVKVWTNTSYEGLPVSGVNHCGAWKQGVPVATARFGLNSAPIAGLKNWQDNRHWTTRDDEFCSKALHLYCFEQ
jgi:hypothetical protein